MMRGRNLAEPGEMVEVVAAETCRHCISYLLVYSCANRVTHGLVQCGTICIDTKTSKPTY